ncbi:hypothetical protein ACOMHN_021373 [Nucella lapillus]
MGQTTTGQIVNLMSNDVNRFDQAVIFLHFLWIGPVQCVAAVIFLHFLWIGPVQCVAVLAILWVELGPSVWAGFAVLLLLMPVQGSMGKLFSKLRRKTAIHTDERVKIMNEIIAGMRVIKMYCWEKPFGEVVEKIRRVGAVWKGWWCVEGTVLCGRDSAVWKGRCCVEGSALCAVWKGRCCVEGLEVKRIRTARYLQALMLAPNFFSVKLILLLTFVTVVGVGGEMTTARVFVTIAVYQAVRVPITVFIPFAIQTMSEMRVCLQRLEVRADLHLWPLAFDFPLAEGFL